MRGTRKTRSTLSIIKLIYSYEPQYLFFALIQLIVNSALPILYVYFPKLFIEKLTDGCRFSETAKLICLYAAVLLILNLVNSFLKNKISVCCDRFSFNLRARIGGAAMKMSVSEIESNKNRELILLANDAASIVSCINLFQNIVGSILTIIGLAVIVSQLNFLILLLVVVTITIKTIIVWAQTRYRVRRRTDYASNNRVGIYLEDVLYFNKGAIKEIRLNNIQPWFMSKIHRWRNEMLSLQKKDFRVYSAFNILSIIAEGVQSLIVLLQLSKRYISGALSLANFTLYFFAVIELTSSLSQITESIGEYRRQIIGLKDFRQLLSFSGEKDLAARDKIGSISSAENPRKSISEFRFTDVCFTYPGSEKSVLNGINLTIKNGEKIVIVGENGSGKTTLIKLLCKFYRPTSGKITLDGVDIWDIDNSVYYSLISSVFQDYSNFAFSIAENVSMSQEFSPDKVSEALNKAGLNEAISNLQSGIYTPLTRLFSENGIELSGGQDQKVAIARALYKDCPIVILDEPTASLDPLAEAEIYERFFDLAKEKTTIFISHRLAASTIADNIAVINDGIVAEYGNHKTLLAQNGLYAKMFCAQRELYSSKI